MIQIFELLNFEEQESDDSWWFSLGLTYYISTGVS